jgi:hypothetical protein
LWTNEHKFLQPEVWFKFQFLQPKLEQLFWFSWQAQATGNYAPQYHELQILNIHSLITNLPILHPIIIQHKNYLLKTQSKHSYRQVARIYKGLTRLYKTLRSPLWEIARIYKSLQMRSGIQIVSILASFWTKSLCVCKDDVNRDSIIQSTLRRLCTEWKIEDFGFPVSYPDDRAIPSGWTSDHCSIRLDDVHFRPDPPLCWEVSIQLASVWTSQQPVQTPLCTRLVSDSFQVLVKERLINHPNDVVSRPDVCLLKARIAIQISPSGRQSALVRMRVHLIWKYSIRLQPSGGLPLMVQTRA